MEVMLDETASSAELNSNVSSETIEVARRTENKRKEKKAMLDLLLG